MIQNEKKTGMFFAVCKYYYTKDITIKMQKKTATKMIWNATLLGQFFSYYFIPAKKSLLDQV